MKFKKIAALAIFGCAALMVSCGGKMEDAAKNVTVKNQMDSLSFAYGYEMGQEFLQSIEKHPMKDSLNNDAIIKGFIAALSKDSTIKEDSIRAIRENIEKGLQKQMVSKEANAFAPVAKKYEAQGFKDLGKIYPGFEGPSVYKKQLVAGKGDSIKPNEFVLVDYVGRLEKTGAGFDSTAERGPWLTPVSGNTIPGFTQALCNLKEGEKATFLIPALLAYGSQGAGDKIPANSDLLFTIEVKKVMHTQEEAQKVFEQIQKEQAQKAKSAPAAAPAK